MPQLPVEVYALEIPPGDMPIPAHVQNVPASLRITMAALDPSAPAQLDLAPEGQTVPRATLKIIKLRIDEDEDDSDEDDEDYDSDDINALEARLKPALGDSDDDDSEEDSEEENGGPSDPSKSKTAQVKKLLESLTADAMDEDEDGLANGVNGVKKNKGKGIAIDEDDDESEIEDDMESEEFVICTLDTTQHYQQPIDITIQEDEQVFFKVIGTHSVYITGNYVADVRENDDDDYSDEDEMDYLGEDMDEDLDDLDEESDELDDLVDPRITEIDSEEEVPKLIKAKADKKSTKKRPAEETDEEPSTLDDLIEKTLKPAEAATKGEKLSKKQAKKLKNNQGNAVPASSDTKDVKKEVNGANGTPSSAKSDKKVQFAKNLEQGPTGSPLAKSDAKVAKEEKKEDSKPKGTLGVKVVQGVKIDDKKLGKGPAAKKGDKVGMRYIGKLEKDGKVFDANKKGPPFSFKIGKGEVIAGWDIGIAGMTVGGERRLTIPAKLGYGNKGTSGIPPNATLVFDVKLISIN